MTWNDLFVGKALMLVPKSACKPDSVPRDVTSPGGGHLSGTTVTRRL